MSPLFGGHDDTPKPDYEANVKAEIERLSALSLVQLGAEVMTKGFGPDGPSSSDGVPSVGMIADTFVDKAVMAGQATYDVLRGIVAEGIQALEHASLVRPHVWADRAGFYAETRYGTSVREQNAVERVLGGGAL
jgi:hypothetical protein